MKKKNNARSGLNPRPKSMLWRPTPKTETEQKIIKYVKAAFRPAWTPNWSDDQHYACVAEAYNASLAALSGLPNPTDEEIREVVNAIATPLKNDEHREGQHAPLFIEGEKGTEVPLTDLRGKTTPFDDDGVNQQIDVDRLSRRPVPVEARKYELTDDEWGFLMDYVEDRIEKTPAIRKRFERLKKKERAFVTYYGMFAAVEDILTQRKRRRQYEKS